jgi:hypothetical protein
MKKKGIEWFQLCTCNENRWTNKMVYEKWVELERENKVAISRVWKKICKLFIKEVPKCVPLAKATAMTSSQKASAVKRKRAAGNPGGKPTNVKTFGGK